MTGLRSCALETTLAVKRAEVAQVESERARLGRDLEAELTALSCHGPCVRKVCARPARSSTAGR